MITSEEYLGSTHQRRDILAAFSALDHSVTEHMNPDEVKDGYDRLLLRLLAISEVHGPGTSRHFLKALNAADPGEHLGITMDFLELGKRPVGEVESGISRRRELQQEILHFSRIVDLQDGFRAFKNKRLRNSKVIPESLKVLCELLTVARGRIIQRGGSVPVPRPRPDQQQMQALGSECLLLHDAEPSDYILMFSGEDASRLKELAYLFSSLLTYLTPYEATIALAVHCSESGSDSGSFTVCLLEPPGPASIPVTQWSWLPPLGKGNDLPGVFPFDLPARDLHAIETPMRLPLVKGQNGEAHLTNSDSREPSLLKLSAGQAGIRIRMAPVVWEGSSSQEMAAKALRLFRLRCDKEITSIESGHIHLDRRIDEDQEMGAVIGFEIHCHLKETQVRPPELCPMVDDDHVLIQLSAKDYENFFRIRNPGTTFELIPESSPVVRAIACGLIANIQGNS